MTNASVLYAAAGLAALLSALLPRALSRLPVSMPMVFLALGAVSFAVVPGLPTPDPVEHGAAASRLSEVCVIIALMGAGLALDRPIGWHRWGSTWRLLGITMPLSMLAVGLLGWGLLGLMPASALLLAAALAPTDPVLASDVQVGEPTEDANSEDEPRFALTSEAGLNDGLAFPFVYAAIALVGSSGQAEWAGRWLAVDVLWRSAIGVLAGLLIGRVLGALFFSAPVPALRLAEQAEGFVALACTFLAYGLAELAHGYGFVAVFVCACGIRAAERAHGFHGVLHQFIEQIERLVTVGLLVLLGGAVARGLLLGLHGWPDVLLALGFVLLIRPVTGAIGLIGSGLGRQDRRVIAFFGVRGIGSVYYLAFAMTAARFDDPRRLWAIAGLVIVVSVLVHGVTATPVMHRVDRLRLDAARARGREERASSISV